MRTQYLLCTVFPVSAYINTYIPSQVQRSQTTARKIRGAIRAQAPHEYIIWTTKHAPLAF